MKSRKIAIMALLTATIFLPALLGPVPVEAAWEPYDGGDHDIAQALIVKDNGVTFMCGDKYDGAGGCDIVIQKKDADGNELWDPPYIYDSDAHYPDHVKAAVFSSNAVYAVGLTDKTDAGVGLNWRIVKCEARALQWQAGYNGDASKNDVAEDVAAAADGHIYVAGWSENTDDTRDLVIQQYSPDSESAVWEDRVEGNPVSLGIEKPVHVEADGGVAYLAGTVLATYGNYAWGLKKYYSDGSSTALLYFGVSGVDRELRDMVAASGYVYLTGKEKTGEEVRMVTRKFAFAGGGGWEEAMNFSGHDATGTNVAVDSSGNVYVLGRCLEPVNITTSLLVKYDASGAVPEQWSKPITFTTSPSGNQSLAVDGAGVPVVTAQSYPDNQIITRWFNPANGAISHEETCSGHGYPAAVGVDSSNNVYVTGSGRFDKVWPSDPDQDIRTLKYTAP